MILIVVMAERECVGYKTNHMYITRAGTITDYNEHSVSLLCLCHPSLMNKKNTRTKEQELSNI